jgi:amino acid adenylation domain-containing protein
MKIQNVTLTKLITKQAKQYPGKIAIKHNGQSITYHELDTRSNQIAAYFIANNITNNDIIAVAIDRSINLVLCLLGLIKAGAAYVPIDPNLPIDRVNFIFENSGAKLLCTAQKYSERYISINEKILFDDALTKCHDQPAEDPDVEYNDRELAYILYTSGSTGQPKGVAIERHSLLNFLLSMQESPGINHKDILLSITTISFDIAELELFLPLISGAQIIIVDNDVAKDGRTLLQLIKTEQASIVQATPFTWRMILQSGWNKTLPIKVFCGGEALAKDLADKLLDKCTELWNMYGPTETTIYSTIKKILPGDEFITIGKPIANTQVYILNKERQQVPNGEEGEIYIGGEGVARGYIGRPDLTNERFIDDPFSGSGGRIYKTGDWGKILENGEVQYLGRIDHQIKIRGYRIETEEIEFQLKNIRGIKDALIILHEDRLGNKLLVAYIVAKGYIATYQRSKKINKWRNSLKNKLPEYMLPGAFILIPRMPLMPNGKLDRKKLPVPTTKPLSRSNKKPSTQTEIIITQIVLSNTDFDHIGINDNFIDLGLDSLIALTIIVGIEEHFNKRLPLTTLVHYPTVKLLAQFIDTASDSPNSSLINLKAGGNKIPLYLVHGIGLNLFNFNSIINHMDPDQPVFGLRAAGLDGNEDPLESIETIAAYYNHEILNHDPVGPYAIAGYSMGGIIAYEMAKQLIEAGKKVEMLAMIDTNVQETFQAPINNILRKAERQIDKLIFRIGSFYNYPVSNVDYLSQTFGQQFKSFLTKSGFRNKYAPSELPGYMQNVIEKLEIACARYIIEPYSLKIDLIKAEQRLYYVDDPKHLGWGSYALNGITTYDVPGDHEDMFHSPNDMILAETLQKRLNEIPANINKAIVNNLQV